MSLIPSAFSGGRIFLPSAAICDPREGWYDGVLYWSLDRHKFCTTAKELYIPYERPCDSLTEVSRALKAWSPAALVCRLDAPQCPRR